MEYVIGIVAATAVGLFGTVIGFDKERSFYPVVLIVIAILYLLFAVQAGSTDALVAEVIPALLFVTAAALGFRKSPWFVVAGLALHGVFDFFHHAVIENPGVPAWWPVGAWLTMSWRPPTWPRCSSFGELHARRPRDELWDNPTHRHRPPADRRIIPKRGNW